MALREARRPPAARSSSPTSPTANVIPEFTPRAVHPGDALRHHLRRGDRLRRACAPGSPSPPPSPSRCSPSACCARSGKATILENNIVQTTGSAGESVAAGVIFTLPALIFLGFPLEYSRIFLLALIGGWLGVLFMIPLRRQLIVKEHGNLLYPEGTACADVLVAGREGRLLRRAACSAASAWAASTRCSRTSNAFARDPRDAHLQPGLVMPGASLRADHHLRVPGRRLHHRAARSRARSSRAASSPGCVMMPAIKFFGSLVPTPIYPSTVPIAADDVGPALELLHPLHRRGRGGRRRPHHPDEDDAHHRRRAARGLAQHADERAPAAAGGRRAASTATCR